MSDQDPSPESLTFGVELEGLIAYRWDDERDPDEAMSSHQGSLITVPRQPLREEIAKKIFDSWNLEMVHLQTHIYPKILQALESHGLPVRIPSEEEIMAKQINNVTHLSGAFNHFDIDSDYSVTMEDPSPYRWYNFELRTPAFADAPDMYEIVRHAVNVLTASFRIIVNDSCGMHVHVGNGLTAPFPLDSLKRIGSFFWAADPLLAVLHPAWRRYNEYCPSIRDRSALALKKVSLSRCLHNIVKAKQCGRYLGREVRFGESPLEWRYQHRDEHFIRSFETTRRNGHFGPFAYADEEGETGPEESADKHIGFPPGDMSIRTGERDNKVIEEVETSVQNESVTPSAPLTLPEDVSPEQQSDGQSASDKSYNPTRNVHFDDENKEIAGVQEDGSSDEEDPSFSDLTPESPPYYEPARVRTLAHIRAPKLDQIQEDDCTMERPQVDPGVFYGVHAILEAGSSCEIAYMFMMGNERTNYNIHSYHCTPVHSSRCRLRTIEFREAAGTMDAEWVSVWSRIVVGLTRWAIHAPWVEFLKVLENCSLINSEKGDYDVLDLLDQVGLVAEAHFVEKWLAQHPDQWEYSGPSISPEILEAEGIR